MLSEDTDYIWEHPINIAKEQWIYLLKDKDVTSDEDIKLLREMYASDGFGARSLQLAQKFGLKDHILINSQVARWGKRIVDKLNIPHPKQKFGEEAKFWHVPFDGKKTKGGFYWWLRPVLREAMEELASTGESRFAEEINLDASEQLYEGAKKQVYVNRYERNSLARYRCIKHYGTKCIICYFDFEERYGEVGRNVIHVHHLKPLSEIGESYRVDPVEDLRPVCPNCHVMIHKRNPPYSIEEVKAMVEKKEPG